MIAIMVYVEQDKIRVQKVMNGVPYKLVAEHQVSHEIIEIPVSAPEGHKTYYDIPFALEEKVGEGQYDYTLYDEKDRVLSQGILQIGDYQPTSKEYVNQNKVKVYEK